MYKTTRMSSTLCLWVCIKTTGAVNPVYAMARVELQRKEIIKNSHDNAWNHYLRHVSHHPPRHLVAGECRRLPQHGYSTPWDLQGSHNALEQRGLATSTGSQQAVSAEGNLNSLHIGLTQDQLRQSEDKTIIKMKISAKLQMSSAKTQGNVK